MVGHPDSQTDMQSIHMNTNSTNRLILLPSLANQDGHPLPRICISIQIYLYTCIWCGSTYTVGHWHSDIKVSHATAPLQLQVQNIWCTHVHTHREAHTQLSRTLLGTSSQLPLALALRDSPCSRATSPTHHLGLLKLYQCSCNASHTSTHSVCCSITRREYQTASSAHHRPIFLALMLLFCHTFSNPDHFFPSLFLPSIPPLSML